MARRKWISRNADIASIEVLDELDDDGSLAPGAGGELIPAWAKYITRIAASAALDGAAIGNGVIFGRLRGGIANGDNELTFVVSGGGVQVATGTQNVCANVLSPPLAVPVNGGERIKYFGEIFGDAENDTELIISVQFSDEPLSDPGPHAVWTRSFTADVDSLDTDVSLTGALGADAAPVRTVPGSTLVAASVASGYDQAADGTSAILVRLKSGPFVDDHVIPGGAYGSIAGQAGSDETAFMLEAQTVPMDCGMVKGSDLNGRVSGEQVGDDLGSGQIGVTLWIAP